MSKSVSFAVFYIFVGLSLTTWVSCDVNAITKLCRFDGCYDLDESAPEFSGQAYNRKLKELFSAGIPQLIYANISDLLVEAKTSVSQSCIRQLEVVSNAMDQGREWAFRFIDSSGKTPSAFLEGSVTSLGDYDECLAIEGPKSVIHGKYCMVDVFPRAPKGYIQKYTNTEGRISLITPRHYNESAYYFGLCFPSACSTTDVRFIVKKVLKPFPLLVEGDLHCDTLESISFRSHFKNMRLGTLISLTFLIAVISAVAWGSLCHILYRNDASALQKSFSAFENLHKLFYVPAESPVRTVFLDWNRFFAIFAAVFAHVSICMESLIGMFILSHHHNLNTIISNPKLSPLFNEGGMGALSFMSGTAFFLVAYPLAVEGRLPFKLTLLDRILRHLPGLASIMALDFTWYLWGSGPFWTRIGQYNVDKCSKTWWKNFLFVSNLWGPSSEICAGHTYFSSVDVHLFIMGFVAVVLLAKRPRVGVAFCSLLIFSSLALLYYYAAVYELQPSIMGPRNQSIPKIEQFLIYVFMSTTNYVPPYMVAILACYTIHLGWWTRFSCNINHIFWIGLCLSTFAIQQYAVAVPNYLDWLSVEWAPAYILLVRIMCVAHNVSNIVYVSLLEVAFDPNKSKKRDVNEKSDNLTKAANDEKYGSKAPNEPSAQGFYSIPKALLRLTFSVYLINYYFIRTDFFSERTTYHNTFYGLVKRFISSFVFVLAAAGIFQIVFLGPFTNLRNLLIKKMSSKEKTY